MSTYFADAFSKLCYPSLAFRLSELRLTFHLLRDVNRDLRTLNLGGLQDLTMLTLTGAHLTAEVSFLNQFYHTDFFFLKIKEFLETD